MEFVSEPFSDQDDPRIYRGWRLPSLTASSCIAACDRADRGAIVGAWWVADILDLERSIWNRIHMGHGLDNYVIIC
jgi:hypothetical protein